MSVGYFLVAIPVFGLLIAIHELGHFSVAKWFDVKVHEFALGFGPAIAGFDRGETRYNLRLVPLGGFVRMAGMEDTEDDPRGFNRKSLIARALIIAAGPIMNFVLTAALLVAFLGYIGPQSNAPVIGEVMAECPVARATTTGTGAVTSGTGAATVPCPSVAAGLRKGDRILTINGTAVATWEDILRLIGGSDGKLLHLQVQRGTQTLPVDLTPVQSEDGRWRVGMVQSTAPMPLGKALIEGPKVTGQMAAGWAKGMVDMITLRVKPELSGPVGITRLIAEQASSGLDNLIFLTAFLSLNLGMFNLLPIPALDGSRLVFIGLEGIRGRRLDPNRENMVHFVGLVLLLGLMLVLTYAETIGRQFTQ